MGARCPPRDCTNFCTVQSPLTAPLEEQRRRPSRRPSSDRLPSLCITQQLEAHLSTTDHFLTIPEAAERLRISRNAAYLAARRYRQTSGSEGLPNIAIGGSYRVPTAALERMANLDVSP